MHSPTFTQTGEPCDSTEDFVRSAANPPEDLVLDLKFAEAVAVVESLEGDMDESEQHYYLQWLEFQFPNSNMSDLISKEPIAFRAIATTNSDAKMLETANLTAERIVTIDDEVIAEWVPMRDDVSVNVTNIGNAVFIHRRPCWTIRCRNCRRGNPCRPKIVSPGRKEMILSPDEIDKVRVVRSTVN